MRNPDDLTPRGGSYPTSLLPPSKVELLVPDTAAHLLAAVLVEMRVPATVGHACSGFANDERGHSVGRCIAFSCPGERAALVAQVAANKLCRPVWLYIGGLEAARITPEVSGV